MKFIVYLIVTIVIVKLICSWTVADLTVACRQLGFSGGKYWEWQDRANNDTAALLYQAPHCSGLEDDITKCAWQTHSMGGGVCGEEGGEKENYAIRM